MYTMSVRKHYEYNPSIDISSANIGINKWEWLAVSHEDDKLASKAMLEYQFDVLPVQTESGEVIKYFSTRKWGDYSKLNLNPITDKDVLYYRTSFKDLIEKFKKSERHYYFLADSREINGLVSYVNLNCQLVYNYLFHLISEIERNISAILKNEIEEVEVVTAFGDSEDDHIKKVLKSYTDGLEKNENSNIYESMFLQTIGITLNKFRKKLSPLACPLLRFANELSPESNIGKLRNRVFHPVRPILSNKESIDQISTLLESYEEISLIIDRYWEN